MTPLWINIVKVGFVVLIYCFLWLIAKGIRSHLATPTSVRADAAAVVPAAGQVIVAITEPGEAAPRHVEVRKVLVVGRGGDADVVIDDPFASDQHLRLRLDSGRLVVEDLGSTNGTLVNDTVVRAPTALERGDVIRVGTTTLEVR